MQRTSGFTLIELMITVAVIAILAAIAYPSYQDHIRRGIRSQGQTYLMDLSQLEEQFFLDQRNYTATIGPGGVNLPLPLGLQNQYSAAVVTLIPGPPQGFRIALAPIGNMAADGTLFINNLQERWRAASPADTAFGAGDCRWEDSRCTPS